MTIYEYKAQFEETMRLAESLPQTAVEQAWLYFKSSVEQTLDENYCEEFGFAAGKHGRHCNGVFCFDENVFSLSFSRLIDNENRPSWNTAEIGCDFLYEMNNELRQFELAIEDAYCVKDDKAEIRRKTDAVFAFADEKQQLWSLVRRLTPIKIYTNFWLY